MLRIITRNAQVCGVEKISENHLYPTGDMPISDLGREQAALLGERLKAQGFCGVILASPSASALETADIIAEITDLQVIPFSPIREAFANQEDAKEYCGLTIEKMRHSYKRIDENATLDFPWWTSSAESCEQIFSRVKAGVQSAEELYSDKEILFVGNADTADALISVYEIPKRMHPFLFNCAISYTDKENSDIRPTNCDTTHILYEKTTSSFLTREEFDKEYFNTPFEGDMEICKEISEIKGVKLLHIGDTESRAFPYFKRLVEEIKPDIILHTGDISDEVKVGRIPETRYEYRSKISFILSVLDKSDARVIIVPGNNDVVEDIREFIPRAEIYKTNSVITLDGAECRIGHQVMRMTFDKMWSFYGHGFTGEEWDYSQNKRFGECRFNACLGSFVCCISENKFFMLKVPKIRR